MKALVNEKKFKILGLPKSASQELIKSNYESLIKIYQSDAFKEYKHFTQKKIKLLNAAYEELAAKKNGENFSFGKIKTEIRIIAIDWARNIFCWKIRDLPSPPKICEQSYLLIIGYGFWGALMDMSQDGCYD